MNFEAIDLNRLRQELVRLEDTIIFALIERAQFARNSDIYVASDKLPFENYCGSFSTTFCTRSSVPTVRRYTSPDEYPFTAPLPAPILPPMDFPKILMPNDINLNEQLKAIYINDIVPMICRDGDDGNYGSSATKDVEALQILSRRIHIGKFVAEAKFNDPKEHDEYVRLIKAKDRDGIMALLTNKAVEDKLLRRLKRKALVYGQEIEDEEPSTTINGKPANGHAAADNHAVALNPPHLRIPLDVVSNMYERFVIPLTKEVEVEYLLRRLDVPDFKPLASFK
ncbi:chorismate mutase [Entophlyctis helioformis]|nr:chorismate mutase [Entophlyctis helioformis]